VTRRRRWRLPWPVPPGRDPRPSACPPAPPPRPAAPWDLHEHDDLLHAARAAWKAEPALRADYRHYRPKVERVVCQVATRGDRNKLRYLDVQRNNAWLKRRTAALNLCNLIGRGLTHDHGTWVLATG